MTPSMEIKRNRSSYVKKAVVQPAKKLASEIIRYGMNNETVARKIETKNTLVFVVDRNATKPEIKAAVIELYKANVKKVTTLNSIKGYKKAFVVLRDEGEAVRIANEAGII